MIGPMHVSPEFLKVLQRIHSNVSADIQSAGSMVQGLSHSVSSTHGLYCTPFNLPFEVFEKTRTATVACLQSVAELLAENLHKANSAYHSTDEGAAKLIKRSTFKWPDF